MAPPITEKNHDIAEKVPHGILAVQPTPYLAMQQFKLSFTQIETILVKALHSNIELKQVSFQHSNIEPKLATLIFSFSYNYLSIRLSSAFPQGPICSLGINASSII